MFEFLTNLITFPKMNPSNVLSALNTTIEATSSDVPAAVVGAVNSAIRRMADSFFTSEPREPREPRETLGHEDQKTADRNRSSRSSSPLCFLLFDLLNHSWIEDLAEAYSESNLQTCSVELSRCTFATRSVGDAAFKFLHAVGAQTSSQQVPVRALCTYLDTLGSHAPSDLAVQPVQPVQPLRPLRPPDPVRGCDPRRAAPAR